MLTHATGMLLLVIHVVVVVGTMSHVTPLTLWHHSNSLTLAVSELHTADPLFWVSLGCVVWEWEASSRSMERWDMTSEVGD